MTAPTGQLPPPQRAADLGHRMQWDPHPQTVSTSRWTCTACTRSALENSRGDQYGAALRDQCPGAPR